MVAREQLERERRRAATRRAFVVEPPPQQLLLRPPAELADRPERHRARAEVAQPRGRLELAAPGCTSARRQRNWQIARNPTARAQNLLVRAEDSSSSPHS